jgi:hypothetical protein
MKLMVAIPTYDGKVGVKTAFEFAALALATQKLGIGLELAQLSGCAIISKARNILVSQFMKSDCTHLLFVDADVSITASAVLKLINVSKDKDIVSGLYPSRVEGKGFFLQLHDEQSDEHLLRVLAIGAGFMLIARHVLQGMIQKHPELAYEDNEETHFALFDFCLKDRKYIGEDYNFCHTVNADGYKIFVDQQNIVGHSGVKEFKANWV